ncbi:ATP-binding protein [Nocardioides pantholopis]|uniref:ATP-binding protein n=1 Tax=Nocardioides pantholopis TaxID=2483798 RepID=UPI000FDBE887|nr:ATP-binding protein [Nocardioides pantholopis]
MPLTPASASGEVFRMLLDAAPDATVIVDERGDIVLVNKQVTCLFGYAKEDLLGKPVDVLVPERFREGHPSRRNGFLGHPSARPMSVDMTLYAVHRDGHEVPVEISLSPLRTDQGLLVSASLRDISERLRMQEEADRMRDELIATVSHELRTPLTSIMGYAELLADLDEDELGGQARRLLAVIQRNAARELRLVDDLLTMAFLQDGRLRFDPEPVALAGVACRVVAEHRARAEAAGLTLAVDVDPVRPVAGDQRRLAQAVENLVANAIKFTPAGGQVRVRVHEVDGSPVLAVTDTGVGVRPEEKARLFDRLYRTPGAVAAQTQGAGLGLAIVRRIVDAHGGRIEVESEPGVGSTFTVRLGYASVDSSVDAPVDAPV